MSSSISDQIYQRAYSIEYLWETYLPDFVYKYHDLMFQECNTPVSLQMGTLLPFVSSLCGPKTRGQWTTRKSVINFFTINIASSGTGKTAARSQLISEPMEYIMTNVADQYFPDMEVNKFTRAGIEDKLRSTGGYCIITTDEGTGFFKDLKNKESKHESDLALLNQLYDGKGDKTTLANLNQRIVPKNSTCMTVSLQQEGFMTGIQSLGYQAWIDNGFSERFMVTASHPFRHKEYQKNAAGREFMSKYGPDFMGKIALGIFDFHREEEILYTLDDEAAEVYQQIADKYNEQFNMKWSNSADDVLLDSQERAEICVRSKSTELIGRLSIILWIYINAFECIHKGKPFDIPTKVSADCVRNADKIIRTSYAHSETFSSAAFSDNSKCSTSMSNPKMHDNNRILAAVIKTPSCVVNIRKLQKNYVRNLNIEIIRDELTSLEDEGFGKLSLKKDQEQVGKSETLGFNPQTVFFKPTPFNLDRKFLERLRDKELNEEFYTNQFRKEIPKELIACVERFHPHVKDIDVTQSLTNQSPKQELDGIVKSSLFAGKKAKKAKSTSENKENETAKINMKAKSLSGKSSKKKDKVERRREISPEIDPLLTENVPESDDENKQEGSFELYSSSAPEEIEDTQPKITKAKTNTYIRVEKSKISTKIKSSTTDTNEESIQIAAPGISGVKNKKTSQKGNNQKGSQKKKEPTNDVFTEKDMEDCLNDSPFEMEKTPMISISAKRKVSNKKTSDTVEIKETTSEVRDRPLRAATKKYQFKLNPIVKIPKLVSDSDKSDKEDLKKDKKKCNMVIEETSSDKSDFLPERNINVPKKRRRYLSKRSRDQQLSVDRKKTSQKTKK